MNKILKTVSIIILFLFLRANVTLAAEQVYFYYTDPAGTPLAMSDSTGNVVWRADYLPFGEETIDLSMVQNNKMFVGKEKDSESGLYYFGARYMDPSAGRFTSPDLVGPVNSVTGKINEKLLANPQRLNRYIYSLNNSYSHIDIDGNLVELTSHSMLYSRFRHTALVLIPNDQSLNWGLYGFTPNQDGQWSATLSAAPGFDGDGGLMLKGDFNRPSDANNRVDAIVKNPIGEGTQDDTAFILNLLNAASNYHNNEGYALAGFGIINDDRNSNGYTAGLLGAVGATVPDLGSSINYPGINNPLPGSDFAPPSLVSSPN